MILNKEEFLWYCPHCGNEKFAWRSAYNFLKSEASKHIGMNKKDFSDRYISSVRDLAERAWEKVNAK